MPLGLKSQALSVRRIGGQMYDFSPKLYLAMSNYHFITSLLVCEKRADAPFNRNGAIE